MARRIKYHGHRITVDDNPRNPQPYTVSVGCGVSFFCSREEAEAAIDRYIAEMRAVDEERRQYLADRGLPSYAYIDDHDDFRAWRKARATA